VPCFGELACERGADVARTDDSDFHFVITMRAFSWQSIPGGVNGVFYVEDQLSVEYTRFCTSGIGGRIQQC
jgi:hypothetical protein